jgi:hypothetical protein
LVLGEVEETIYIIDDEDDSDDAIKVPGSWTAAHDRLTEADPEETVRHALCER